ncbi:hypothetical protein Bbelb_004720 [Branchiostoma belcheri]|nr:hypothetical protein Bbelb_004720 [Branchiostoma belcheri]
MGIACTVPTIVHPRPNFCPQHRDPTLSKHTVLKCIFKVKFVTRAVMTQIRVVPQLVPVLTQDYHRVKRQSSSVTTRPHARARYSHRDVRDSVKNVRDNPSIQSPGTTDWLIH